MTVQNFQTVPVYQAPQQVKIQNYQNHHDHQPESQLQQQQQQPQHNMYPNQPQTPEQIETSKLLHILRTLLPFQYYVDDATLIRNAAAYIEYLTNMLAQQQ